MPALTQDEARAHWHRLQAAQDQAQQLEQDRAQLAEVAQVVVLTRGEHWQGTPLEAVRELIQERERLRAALGAAIERMEAVAESIPVTNRHKGVSQATHVAHMAGHLAQHANIARAALAAVPDVGENQVLIDTLHENQGT